MSANNIVWSMEYNSLFHVFYSGCADNTPTKPDFFDKYYKSFMERKDALEYAHDIVNKIDIESELTGTIGVEYGVCELLDPNIYRVKTHKPTWIPQDIDEYFREHFSDLTKIKYDRLLEFDKNRGEN